MFVSINVNLDILSKGYYICTYAMKAYQFYVLMELLWDNIAHFNQFYSVLDFLMTRVVAIYLYRCIGPTNSSGHVYTYPKDYIPSQQTQSPL